MTTNLELFSDYVCPWCYFMTGRMERLRNEYDVSITWRSFPLHPDTPLEGRNLDEIYQRYPYPKADMLEHLRRNARALNMPYCERSKVFNSRMAQELGVWAESQDAGEMFHKAAFAAYFVNNQNLADRVVLLEIVRQIGLDVTSAELILDQGSFSDAVERDWQRAEELGIDVVPTFVIGESKLVGAQEYRSLSKFVTENSVARK
ncbi:DsbA family protein [Thermodesulfobacteriota bacterium]